MNISHTEAKNNNSTIDKIDCIGYTTSNEKTAVYLRFPREFKGNYLFSEQFQKCVNFTCEHQMEIIGIYEDRGYSGRNHNRPALLKMMEDARRGLFKSILIHKLDRFSRNIENTSHYINELSNLNVMLITASENFDFSSGPGRLYFHRMAVFAQWYLDNLC
jgi:site-specific DNA recombinase